MRPPTLAFSPSGGEAGLAVVEFLVVVVALVVPIGYAALAVERVHATAVTAQSAASAAALSVARGTVPERAADRVVAGYWHEAPGRVDTSVRCLPRPCVRPGGTVTVDVETSVPLPLVPGGWATVPVRASESAPVDRFAAADHPGS